MYRLLVFISIFFFLTTQGFAQQKSEFRIVGRVPSAADERLYKLQVGSFKDIQSAERVSQRLAAVLLPSNYENDEYTRVMVSGLKAADILLCVEILKAGGFYAAFLSVDTLSEAAIQLPHASLAVAQAVPAGPVSNAVVPSPVSTEVGHSTIRIGENRNVSDLVSGVSADSWISSTPEIVAVDSAGNITGLSIGSGLLSNSSNEYISIAVVPAEGFYIVPESQTALLPPASTAGNTATGVLQEYKTEPTFRLAYRFNNKGEYRGASGLNGGIDILARGPNYEWLWTTYRQGGWFYDLNGIKREMVNGYQRGPNGVDLIVLPEFVYDDGVPYLQLKHILHNANNYPVTGQKFGASADVMIHNNDYASLIQTDYGAYMADSQVNPSLELMFIGKSGSNITPVDTLWLGEWDEGWHLENIYNDRRIDVHGVDSAIAFSYQNIDLAPGERKEFIVRFTLARPEE
jgi:hypothetical protein